MASDDLIVERCRNVFLCFMAPKCKPVFFIWWLNKEVMTWFPVGDRGDCIGLVRDIVVGHEHFKGFSKIILIIDDFSPHLWLETECDFLRDTKVIV